MKNKPGPAPKKPSDRAKVVSVSLSPKIYQALIKKGHIKVTDGRAYGLSLFIQNAINDKL